MGAWGAGALEDARSGTAHVEEPEPEGARALEAEEVVAALGVAPAHALPDGVRAWVEAGRVGRTLLGDAHAVVDLVSREQSELGVPWDDTGEDCRRAGVAALRHRLGTVSPA